MDRFSVLIWRDLRLAIRSKTIWLQSVLFFVIFIALSGIAMGGDNDSLGRFAPALIWLAVIFALLLSFEGLFRDDYQDGSLDLLKISGMPGSTYVTAKATAHWMSIVLPLLIVLPVVSLLLGLSFSTYAGLLFAILLASPALIILGSFCGACLVGNKSGSMLIILLAIPLFVPLIIFGTSAADSYVVSGWNAVEFKALLGLSLISCAIGIPATAAALDAIHE
ncbi:MAG: heme exporter protein CcmB [Hyphomonadaceae bacterium]|nr:heme exporter protein CcmB [Hyphomonadaceae bacterium]